MAGNLNEKDNLAAPLIKGIIKSSEENEVLRNVNIMLWSGDGKQVGTGKTDSEGRYSIKPNSLYEPSANRRLYMTVSDNEGRIIEKQNEIHILFTKKEVEVNLLISEENILRLKRKTKKVQLGQMLIDAKRLQEATPELVYDIAKMMLNIKNTKKVPESITSLNPEIFNVNKLNNPVTSQIVFEGINEIIKIKKWPVDVYLELYKILSMLDAGFFANTYETTNFIINYYTSGSAAVDASTAPVNIMDPGANPPVTLTTTTVDTVPSYVKVVAYWCEKAMTTYTTAPIGMLNPASSGKINVYITTESFGHADSLTNTFYINNSLSQEIVCAVSVHELFHLVEFMYPGAGDWLQAMREGIAVMSEDCVADFMNRYLDEADTNFNSGGVGLLGNPNKSIKSSSYKSSLFWRYIAEQHSSNVTAANEPKIGVEVYRTLYEKCSSGGGFSTSNVKSAIRNLPWYQDFYEFSYGDIAGNELSSSETTLGNFALACYLKDLGVNIPDRRFDFMEDEENIYIDDILHPLFPTTEPLKTSLGAAVLAGSSTLTTTNTITYAGSVNSFGRQYYEVQVDPAVASIQIDFTAGVGLTSRIFQVALIDESNNVRDIIRTDKGTLSKRVANAVGGVRLSKIALIVAGGDSTGSYNLLVTSASASSDVMVTRWNSEMKKEYHIDSKNWAWTWVSPDIWVDNDGDGIADGEVFFDYNNKLHIQLHNKGNADAAGIQVQLYYQDATGGLDPGDWLPVQNKAGTTQILTGLSLTANTSNNWSVDWSPVSTGTSHHFCIKAEVTVPGDPNTDNKYVTSNFGNVKASLFSYIHINILRKNAFNIKKQIKLTVIPRMNEEFEIMLPGLIENQVKVMEPGEFMIDRITILHKKVESSIKHDHDHKLRELYDFRLKKRLSDKPSINGCYRVNPNTMPPGIANKPMITVVYEVDGIAIGGVTYMLSE